MTAFPEIWDEPYLVRTAIRWLGSILVPGMRVLEWGCGASTIWFAKHGLEVHTIEHDEHWLGAVLEKAEGLHVHGIYIDGIGRPFMERYSQGALRALLERAKGLPADALWIEADGPGISRPFVERYSEAPRTAWAGFPFSLILIDGHDDTRAACARVAVSIAKPNTYVILDNAGAKAHEEALRVLMDAYGDEPSLTILDAHQGVPAFGPGFRRLRFIGEVAMPGPIQKTETCVWRVP